MTVAATIVIDGVELEYVRVRQERTAPVLVFLHEGLGSVAMWRDFPQRLAASCGCPALIYSREGYGRSAPLAAPRRTDYMHEEALVRLPALLDRLGIAAPILIGHSDGASIALIHAGAHLRPVRACVALAPHVFVEDVSIAGIAAARDAYANGTLRERLARYHRDVDSAFRGWNEVWLSPDFRDWNIESYIAAIDCPLLLIQGRDDEYGTLAQLDVIERVTVADVSRRVLDDCGRSPQRDQPEATLNAMAGFISQQLRSRP
ncbi:MAG: alpha/beta hydrolase [Casimicrobiaceae bacterium]